MGRGVLPVVACLFAADSLRAFVAYHGKADVYLSHILGAYPVSSGNADPPPTSSACLFAAGSFTHNSFSKSQQSRRETTHEKNGYNRNWMAMVVYNQLFIL